MATEDSPEIFKHQFKNYLAQDFRRKPDAASLKTRAEMCTQQEVARQQQVMITASDERAKQLAKVLGKLRDEWSYPQSLRGAGCVTRIKGEGRRWVQQ